MAPFLDGSAWKKHNLTSKVYPKKTVLIKIIIIKTLLYTTTKHTATKQFILIIYLCFTKVFLMKKQNQFSHCGEKYTKLVFLCTPSYISVFIEIL
jgi:hypothetical protein